MVDQIMDLLYILVKAPLFLHMECTYLVVFGDFKKEEDEIIEQHMKSKNGDYDLNYLKDQLNRPRKASVRT